MKFLRVFLVLFTAVWLPMLHMSANCNFACCISKILLFEVFYFSISHMMLHFYVCNKRIFFLKLQLLQELSTLQLQIKSNQIRSNQIKSAQISFFSTFCTEVWHKIVARKISSCFVSGLFLRKSRHKAIMFRQMSIFLFQSRINYFLLSLNPLVITSH